MKNPVQALIARCDVGFYLWQKVGLTILGLAYLGSPLDLLPDLIPVLGWGDDVYVVYLLVRVWMSPTLPTPDGRGTELAAAPYRQTVPLRHTRVPAVRRENAGGVA